MAEQLGVSLEVLKSTVQQLRTQKDTMSKKLSDISSAVSGLTAVYQSPAAEELKTLASNMSDRFQALEQQVKGFADTLEAHIINYDNASNKEKQNLDKNMKRFKK